MKSLTAPRAVLASLVLIVLINLSVATKADATSIRCHIATKWSCSETGCKTATPTIHNLINFNTTKYWRCDQKGCDAYDMAVTRSGNHLNILASQKSILAKLGGSNLEHFTEVVTLGTVVLVSHEKMCKYWLNIRVVLDWYNNPLLFNKNNLHSNLVIITCCFRKLMAETNTKLLYMLAGLALSLIFMNVFIFVIYEILQNLWRWWNISNTQYLAYY
jgi:hypothetical protein